VSTWRLALSLAALMTVSCSDPTSTSESVSIFVSSDTIQHTPLLAVGLPLEISNRGSTAVHVVGEPIVEREIRASEWQAVPNVLVVRVIDGPLQIYLGTTTGAAASYRSSAAFRLQLDLSAGRYRLSQGFRRLDAFMGNPIDASEGRAYSNTFVVVE